MIPEIRSNYEGEGAKSDAYAASADVIVFPSSPNAANAANVTYTLPASTGVLTAALGSVTVTTSGKTMADPTREEIEAKIAASEARGDTRIVGLSGKLDTLEAKIAGKLDHISTIMETKFASLEKDIQKSDSYNRDSRLIIVASLVAAVIALAGVWVAMASYGDAVFSRGMNVHDVIQTTIKETQEQMKYVTPQTPSKNQ